MKVMLLIFRFGSILGRNEVPHLLCSRHSIEASLLICFDRGKEDVSAAHVSVRPYSNLGQICDRAVYEYLQIRQNL